MECSKAQMTYLRLCNESEIEIATMASQQYSLNEKNKIIILSQLKLECYKNEIIKKHDFEKEKIYFIAYV